MLKTIEFIPVNTMSNPARLRINPKKLLHSKWTAVKPLNKEKHFMVVKLLLPEDPLATIEFVELEAVYSNRIQLITWRELQNDRIWQRGWR